MRLGLGTCYERFDANVHDPFNTPLPDGRRWVRCEEEPCCSGEYELCRDDANNFTVTRTDDPGTPVTSSNCADLPDPPASPVAGHCYNYCFALPPSFGGQFTAGPKPNLGPIDGLGLHTILVESSNSEGVRMTIRTLAAGVAEIVVATVSGQEVHRSTVELSERTATEGILIDGSKAWASGVYVYAITINGEAPESGKIVVP